METTKPVRGLTVGETFFTHLDFPCVDNKVGMVTVSIEVLALDSIRCGFSFASPNDAYDRKKGNLIAEGRRKNYRNFAATLAIPNNATMKQIKQVLRNHLGKLELEDTVVISPEVAWNPAHTRKETMPRWFHQVKTESLR